MLVATKPRLRRVDWSKGMNGIMVFGYSVMRILSPTLIRTRRTGI